MRVNPMEYLLQWLHQKDNLQNNVLLKFQPLQPVMRLVFFYLFFLIKQSLLQKSIQSR